MSFPLTRYTSQSSLTDITRSSEDLIGQDPLQRVVTEAILPRVIIHGRNAVRTVSAMSAEVSKDVHSASDYFAQLIARLSRCEVPLALGAAGTVATRSPFPLMIGTAGCLDVANAQVIPSASLRIVDTVPIGTIIAFPSDEILPDGYVPCDGSPLSIEKYPDLYKVLGKKYGSSGVSFHVPDYRGYFLRGWNNNGKGVDSDAQTRRDRGDGTTGDKVGTKQGDATKRPNVDFEVSKTGGHTHEVTGGAHQHIITTTSLNRGHNNRVSTQHGQGLFQSEKTDLDGGHSHTVSFSGSHTHVLESGGDKETRPKNINVVYLIKCKDSHNKPDSSSSSWWSNTWSGLTGVVIVIVDRIAMHLQNRGQPPQGGGGERIRGG